MSGGRGHECKPRSRYPSLGVVLYVYTLVALIRFIFISEKVEITLLPDNPYGRMQGVSLLSCFYSQVPHLEVELWVLVR